MKHSRLFIFILTGALLIMLFSIPQSSAVFNDAVTLNVFRGDTSSQPAQNNKIYQLIEERFGVKFNFEFLPEDGNLDESVGLILATEDYPDRSTPAMTRIS